MAALVEAADPAHILYGSDWPYVRREFVRDQMTDLVSLPQFAGKGRAALEWRNAADVFGASAHGRSTE